MAMTHSRHPRRQKPPNGRQAGGTSSQARQPSRPASGRAADAIDLQVGSRVRLARKALDMTQEALAAQLGITFQQLQKYEKGINRISASRLHHAAKVLGVPVSFFFPEAEPAPVGEPGIVQPLASMDFLKTAEAVELNWAFSQIDDAGVRQRVIDLVRSIAMSSEPAGRIEGPRPAEAREAAGRGASPETVRQKRVRGIDR